MLAIFQQINLECSLEMTIERVLLTLNRKQAELILKKWIQFDTVNLEKMNYDDKIEEAQFAASLLLLVVSTSNFSRRKKTHCLSAD